MTRRMWRSWVAAISLPAMVMSAQLSEQQAGGERYPEPAGVPSHFPRAVVADHALVAAAHPLAARAGVNILQAGGNAIDATVAVQMVLNVVEPQSSGIGGGCFILFHEAKSKRTHCIDGREECPAEAKRADFLDPLTLPSPPRRRGEGEGVIAEDLTGGLPVGVPGTVAAMWLAHEKWGKLPIAQVLAPAIRLAEEGIGVSPRLRLNIEVNRRRLLRFPSSKKVFLHADGSAPDLGEVFKQPDLARTLQLLAAQGPRVFYEGEIARDIVKTVREAPFQPGRLSLQDLKSYRAVFRQPVRFRYRDHEIVSMPPPSSGGITLGLMLGMIEHIPLTLPSPPRGRGQGEGKPKPRSVAEIELLARTGNAAFADRNAYLGDQDWCDELDMRTLLDAAYVKERAAVAASAKPGAKLGPGKPGPTTAESGRREGEHTSHFSIMDREGNLVACTTTIEHGMGSALVVEGRGFLLNNELTDFDLDLESGPNALDARRRPRRTSLADNDPPAGKRPRSSMTPVIVFKEGKPVLAAGSPGGPRIIGTVAQVIVNVLDHGMDVQQAVNAPRMNSRNGPLGLEVLYPNRRELAEALQARGWKLEGLNNWYETWGGVQAIRIRPDGKLEGGADPRREGSARGY